MTLLTRFRGSLAAKLLLIVAAISVVIALLISGLEIRQERDATIATRQSEARAAVMANLDTLALAVWSFDERLVNVTGNSLIRGTSIVRAEVSQDGEKPLTFDRSPQSARLDYSWEIPLLRPGTEQRIGTLRLWENYDDVRAQVAQRATSVITSELVKILATSVLLLIAVYILITRPLSVLATKVQQSWKGDDAGAIVVNRPLHKGVDAIDTLIGAINSSNAERLQMEAERRRNQAREAYAGKLEALGQLAGGIAHDFNNLLGAILGFAGLLKEDLPDGTKEHRFAERIVAAGERGKELVEQIRLFARAEDVKREVVDLRLVARQSERLLSSLIPKSTRLIFVYADTPVQIFGSEARLGQLVANLCFNASEALNEQAGGVTVSVEHASREELAHLLEHKLTLDERFLGKIDAGLEYACLRVTDTADGIPNAILDRIFEPFFTTKGRKRGTGLGLAVAHGVIESHGGACHVQTRAGAGTTFSVYLPLYRSGVVEPAASEPVASDVRGSERILIVDDETDIVDSLSIGLERLGYESVGVNDPLEALQVFHEDPDAWDVVVTDEVMPGMRGLELIKRLKAIRPNIKAVLCTGYSDGANEDAQRATGVDVFLLKPVNASSIAAKLRSLARTAA